MSRGGARRTTTAGMEIDLDLLAEQMAETDGGYIVAGRACGLSKDRSKAVWRAMRNRLGWQAA